MISTDEEWMKRVAGGSLAALGELFDRYHLRLYRFLCRILGDSTLAEELVGEVFMRVWKRRTTFDPVQKFSVWLYVIARSIALDEGKKSYRRERRFSELPESDQLRVERAGEPTVSGEGMDEALVLREEVRKALQALPEDQRVAMVLREYESRSFREIGEVMGCTEGRARVLVFRARQALRVRLHAFVSEEEIHV